MTGTGMQRRGLAPYICVKGAAEAIGFYVAAFGAKESFRLAEPDGRIGHAELVFGDTVLMISDEYPDFGALSPGAMGGSPVALHLTVDDCDAATTRAIDAGATELRAPRDEFYGDRSAMVACPFGYRWHLSAVNEIVTPEEMQRRWSRMLAGGEGA